MIYGNCKECKHYYECYPTITGSSNIKDSAFEAITSQIKRDLCVNNDKQDWKQVGEYI